VNLTSDEARAAYYCAAALIRHRQRSGEPIPEWLRKHFNRLDAEVRVSESGHDSVSDAKQLEEQELITAREAAGILGCSKRQVQRLASDLDAEFAYGRWLFRLSTVAEYAEAKGGGRNAI
jgi:hypothetical protein